MPIHEDNEAERLARIEQLLTEARLMKASLRPADHQLRRELGAHLDRLLIELRGPFQSSKRASKPQN
jgi:hypothetical protein